MDPKTPTHPDTPFIYIYEEEMGVFWRLWIYNLLNIGIMIIPPLLFASSPRTKVQGMVNYSLMPIYKYHPRDFQTINCYSYK